MKKVVIPKLSQENYNRLKKLAVCQRRSAGAQAQVIIETYLQKNFDMGGSTPKPQESSK